MLLSGSIGGLESSLRHSMLHQRDNRNVFAGDAIFTQGCQIPFLQHIFFLLDSDYFLACSSLLSHPARPIQLIFNWSKYESTKINLSCFKIKSDVLLWSCNAGLHRQVRLSKARLTLYSALCFCLHSVPRKVLSCLCHVREHEHPSCMCLCRHPTCSYVGTTCYSQGWSSPRPVSLCVYSSGGLLPPDYKKDWWINNIQLSLALAHTLWGLEVSVCLRVRIDVSLCVRVHMCLHLYVCFSVLDSSV